MPDGECGSSRVLGTSTVVPIGFESASAHGKLISAPFICSFACSNLRMSALSRPERSNLVKIKLAAPLSLAWSPSAPPEPSARNKQ